MYRRDHFNEALEGAGLRRRHRAICVCGAPILMGARFCPSCGRAFDVDVVAGEDTSA